MIAVSRRKGLRAMAGAGIALASAEPTHAQPAQVSGAEPHVDGVGNGLATAQRPLRVLIGFSPRSASDDLMRLLQPEFASNLGRDVSIELMPGELGAKAARAAISSPPDGGTLLIATFGTHAINPNLKPDLDYDPVKDFTPVCLATRSPLIMGTRPSLGAKDVAGFIALASRTELTYGSSGVGSAPYLAALLFQKMTGVKMIHRAYSDTRVLYEDLEAEHLDLSFNNASTMLPQVRDGRLRALAVTTAQRSAALPNVPTLAEAGLQGYALDNWLGLVAPPRTAADIVSVQEQAIVAALRTPSIARALANNGIEVIGGTSLKFAAYISSEIRRWSSLRP